MVERDINKELEDLREHMEYRHTHKGMKSLDRRINRLRKEYVVNMREVIHPDGHKEDNNVGEILVNKEIMERLI